MDEELRLVAGCLCALITPAAVLVIWRIRSDSAAAAKAAAAAMTSAAKAARERHRKGKRITDAIASLPIAAERERALQQLRELMEGDPIGFVPDLSQFHGWFEQVGSILRSLLTDPDSADVVDMYFGTFQFPPGQQSTVLAWLNDVLALVPTKISDQQFIRCASRVLTLSGPEEADWLYRRALEALRRANGDPVFKGLVLHVGRLRYASTRPDRQLTLYDEQAIANDITACVR